MTLGKVIFEILVSFLHDVTECVLCFASSMLQAIIARGMHSLLRGLKHVELMAMCMLHWMCIADVHSKTLHCLQILSVRF